MPDVLRVLVSRGGKGRAVCSATLLVVEGERWWRKKREREQVEERWIRTTLGSRAGSEFFALLTWCELDEI